MKEGPSAIMKELSLVRSEMKKVKVDDVEYPRLRARENIIHQFEVIHTKNEHVGILIGFLSVGSPESMEF